jgi:alpha-2-macroglobulin
VRTSAIILAALLRLRPADPILPQAVRGLMAARQFGYWSNTQETAWSIIALTDWLVATRELEGNYTWEVKLNEQELGNGTMNAESLTQKVELRGALFSFLQDETYRLEIARSNPSGQLYYATQLRYAVDALAVQPINQGITVDRRFEIDDSSVNTATVGDLITMTVRISTSRELHHTLIEMPIPAGSEPIDQRLATEAGTLGNELRQRQSWADEGGFPVEYNRLWPTYVDIRDDKIALFVTNLPPGQYFVTFPIRATLPGRYRVLPVHAEMMYFTAIMGRSAGDQFEIQEAEKR